MKTVKRLLGFISRVCHLFDSSLKSVTRGCEMHSKDIRAPVSLLKVKMITLKNSPKLNWCYFAKKKKKKNGITVGLIKYTN